MGETDDVCVLIPTFNEAETIGDVVAGYREGGYDTVLVMDGGSTDGTRDIAREAGASVRIQSGDGKGQAIREALTYIDAPYVIMADGDMTYRPDEAERMLEPILAGRAEHVIGDRFANIQPGAMPWLNRLGNRLFNGFFRVVHGHDFGDILSGYRAFTLESARSLFLTEDGFGIETEMAVECVKKDVPVEVVPITYQPRPAGSEANLDPFRDGAIIIRTLYQMARTSNPLFYFGSIGALSTLFGILVGAFVAVEWFTQGISHEVLALASGVAILFGVQLFFFGLLSDLIVTLNEEQTRQFERLTERLAEQGEPTADGHDGTGEPDPDGTDAGAGHGPSTAGADDEPGSRDRTTGGDPGQGVSETADGSAESDAE
jgi:glycosyltransferase (TIGR04182 family)